MPDLTYFNTLIAYFSGTDPHKCRGPEKTFPKPVIFSDSLPNNHVLAMEHYDLFLALIP